MPEWADQLRRRYLAGESSMFLLHGNTRDLTRWGDEYVDVKTFLEGFLGRSKELVITYNVSQGLGFLHPPMKKKFMAAINARRALDGFGPIDVLPSRPGEVLPLLECLMSDASHRVAIILDFVEMIVPMSDLSYMGDADKSNLVAMQRWAADPGLLASDSLVVMLTEHLSDVHRRLVGSAQLATVRLPLPEESVRHTYIESEDRSGVDAEMDSLTLAKITGGLSLLQIRSLFRRARQSGESILFRTVSRRKKEIIERECHGLV